MTFVQLSAEAFIHRDAVRFVTGEKILLQRLQCGQRVDVLSLDPQGNATSDEEANSIAALRKHRRPQDLESANSRRISWTVR